MSATGAGEPPAEGRRDRRALAGSERAPLGFGQAEGPVGGEPVDVTLMLRRRAELPPVGEGTPLTREQYAAQHGADPADIAKVTAFAAAEGLTVVEADPARRRVVLRGPANTLAAAFGVHLTRVQHEGATYRTRTGPVQLPVAIADAVTAVLGLDNRPQARPHLRHHRKPQAAASFTPVQVGAAYGFPTGLDGTGQTIAVVELGGGYEQSDLTTYFDGLGIPVPTVESVSVDGASNAPGGGAGSADGEVALDIEVAGALAPAARLAVYFAPNTDRGFLDAVSDAVHDTTRNPSVISISWGGPEPSWTAQAMTAMDQVFEEAAALGVTVCVAAGDNGSGDGVSDGQPHVDFPASSPNVLACGGTRLEVSGQTTTETVWNDLPNGGATGGGISATFPRPQWQQQLTMPAATGRGVPDVAGDADPQTGYQVRVDGTDAVFGGTSAVAPLWAALLACLAGAGTPLGFVVPKLYAAGAGTFRDITEGDNGAYSAGPGWDACTGLGSPIGSGVAAALGATQPAQPTAR